MEHSSLENQNNNSIHSNIFGIFDPIIVEGKLYDELASKDLICMLIFLKYLIFKMKLILDNCKSMVDAELLYNLSSFSNYENLHLLRSDSNDTAVMHVLHPRVILFLFLISFIYFGICILRDVFPIHILPSTVLAPKIFFVKLVILYHCAALILIFEVYASISLQ